MLRRHCIWALSCFFVFLLLSATDAQEQPSEPAVVADSDANRHSYPGVLILVVVSTLVLATVAGVSSFLTYRMNRIRFAAGAHQDLISFNDVARDWLEDMRTSWTRVGQLQNESLAEHKTSVSGLRQRVEEGLSTLQADFGNCQASMASELAEFTKSLTTLTRLTDEQREELTLYKNGFRQSLSDEVLGYLCDARDQVRSVIRLFQRDSSDSTQQLATVKQALMDLDWLLEGHLERCCLKEVKISPGDRIIDECLSGRWKNVETVQTGDDRLHGTVVEVVKIGYVIDVGGDNEKKIFRQAWVRIYAVGSTEPKPSLGKTN